MKTKRIISVMCASLLAISAFTGCAKTATSSKEDENTIKLGLNFELSGAVAQYGQACVDGIKMAVDEVNADGGVLGKKIKLVSKDNSSKQEEAVSVATTLATKDNVIAILGPATSGATKATIPISNKYSIPVISGSATADDVTFSNGKLNPFIYRICFNDSFQGQVMGSFAANELKLKNAVILSDNSMDYSKGLADVFSTTYKKLGGTIVATENFSSKNSDFSSVLTKIKSQKFDVIYLPAYYEEVGRMIKQARAMGINQPILGADGYDDTRINEVVGNNSYLNNVYFTNHYSKEDTSDTVVNFIKNFKAKNKNKTPNAFNALGYDLAKFVVDAIKRAGTADKASLNKALGDTKQFDGVTGSFSVDEKHNPVKSTVIIKLVDGVQKFDKKFTP